MGIKHQFFWQILLGFFLCQVTLGASNDSSSSTTPEVEVVGNKFFFANNGSQFLIRGIAYQQDLTNLTNATSFTDPLADADACKRDVEYLQKIQTNVLRVYAVDTEQDHSECMKTFEDAGIYIIADLSEPDLSIQRDSPSWNLDLYKRYTNVVDTLANYSNVLGFFAGNEVTNNKSNTNASAFVKAAVRDTKAYISHKNYRSIPVGYSTNDDSDTRIALADYFACGDSDERADFLGVNMYEWCDPKDTFESSGWEERTQEYSNLTIPVFFSEYGCNTHRPRQFTEVGTLFSDKMTDVWSGGIVYMYFEEDNNYGLVSVDGDDVKTLDDYNSYSSQINKISPSYAKSSSITEATKTVECPALASTWEASDELPPTPDESVCNCVAKTLGCVVDDSVSSEDYGKLFGIVCGEEGVCDQIKTDAENGEYGEVSFCSEKEQLSFVLNAYYEKNDKDSSACDFKGSASINKNASSNKSCSIAASNAASGSAGTSFPDASGSSSSGSKSKTKSSSKSTSSSSSSSSGKKSGASFTMKRVSKGELFAISAMVTCFVGGLSLIVA